MSTTQQARTSIDEVLERAVEAGAVPNVAAIAADRDGIVYEGAAGPRVAGEADPVTVDTHFRIMSMTKMVATVAALQLVERGALDLDAPVERYCPEWAELQVLDGFDGDTPRLRPPASQGDRQAPRHPHVRPRVLVLERRHRPLGDRDRDAQRPVRRERDLHGAAGRRPGHAVRVRHQHRLARQGDRGGEREHAGRRDRRAHHRAARDDRDGVPDVRRSSARSRFRCTSRARTASGRRARSSCARTPSTGPAATACTRRRATT